jgi:tetratricopeptide (TPR) repeat protein
MDSVGGLNALSSTLIWLGRFREALSVTQEALARCKNTGNRNQSPFAYRNLGEAKLHLGHYADARSALQNGLDVLQETGEIKFLVATLATLGEVALALGTYPEVCEVLEERITLAGEVEGWRVNYERTVGLTVLAYAAHNLGEHVQAQEYLARALRPAIRTQNTFSLIQALSAASLVLAKSAESAPVRAVELYALASRYPHIANSRWYEDVVGKHITAMAETLPADAVAAAQERGEARDLWETAEELLAEWGT